MEEEIYLPKPFAVGRERPQGYEVVDANQDAVLLVYGESKHEAKTIAERLVQLLNDSEGLSVNVRIPKGVSRKLGRAAFEAGKAAGEVFQAQFDRTGGRERKLPKPPDADPALSSLWKAGFDYAAEEALMAMMCAGCGEELKDYEEQVCTDCLDKYEERLKDSLLYTHCNTRDTAGT